MEMGWQGWMFGEAIGFESQLYGALNEEFRGFTRPMWAKLGVGVPVALGKK
jgi:hypothetical protein